MARWDGGVFEGKGSLSQKEKIWTEKQLTALGREIAALKLNTNEELQAYVTVAKTALKKGVEELFATGL